MLQPQQLKEVLNNYREEIIELQDFLQKAKFVFGTDESLPALIDRLQQDRGFRRDLTSHLWVVIHTSARSVTYADLLGILAIAAAGTHFAEQAREEDAHLLLHFVMEARRSLDRMSGAHRIPVMDPSATVASSAPAVLPVREAPLTPSPSAVVAATEYVVPPAQVVESVPFISYIPQEQLIAQPVMPLEPEPVQPEPAAPEMAQKEDAPSSRAIGESQYSVPLVFSPEAASEQPAELPFVSEVPELVQPQAAIEAEAPPISESRREFRVPTVDPSRLTPSPASEEAESSYTNEPATFRANALTEKLLSPEEEKARSSRKRYILIAAGVLVLVAGGATWGYFQSEKERRTPRPPSIIRTEPAALEAPTASQGSTPASSPSDAVPAPAPVPVKEKPSPEVGDSLRQAPTASTRTAKQALAVSPNLPAETHPAPSKPVATAPVVTPPAIPPPAATPAPIVRVTPAPVPAPGKASATTPAPRPNSFAIVSGTADFSHTTAGHPVPYLHRRTPQEQKELLAESQPAPALPSTKFSPSASASQAPQSPGGTVSAITLGSNASYVVYSPTPTYPSAASSAHVQGEVKVETDVDREGRITAARVMSGPPALREAALDAAQRWRYKPNKVGGQAIPMSVVNVFQFQLQQ